MARAPENNRRLALRIHYIRDRARDQTHINPRGVLYGVPRPPGSPRLPLAPSHPRRPSLRTFSRMAYIERKNDRLYLELYDMHTYMYHTHPFAHPSS